MRQPIKKGKLINKPKPKTKKRLRRPDGKLERVHPKFGTSKLEQDFAEQFLDTLGIDYIWQFEAKDIGRFYDFAVILNNEMTTGNMLLIEIDGGYYHSDPRVVKEDKLNPMQKHNKRVDEYKDKWALLHGIPLIRIWEKDIRENPKGVMKELKKRLYIEDKRVTLTEKKNKRHVNKIK
jgi:very-short-patch-repair endonuclease